MILCAGDLVRDAPTADHWLSGIEPAERRALPIVARVMLSAGMLFAAGGVNHAAGQSASSILDELEPVIVTGVRPGPALWKISSGDHTFD